MQQAGLSPHVHGHQGHQITHQATLPHAVSPHRHQEAGQTASPSHIDVQHENPLAHHVTLFHVDNEHRHQQASQTALSSNFYDQHGDQIAHQSALPHTASYRGHQGDHRNLLSSQYHNVTLPSHEFENMSDWNLDPSLTVVRSPHPQQCFIHSLSLMPYP